MFLLLLKFFFFLTKPIVSLLNNQAIFSKELLKSKNHMAPQKPAINVLNVHLIGINKEENKIFTYYSMI